MIDVFFTLFFQKAKSTNESSLRRPVAVKAVALVAVPIVRTRHRRIVRTLQPVPARTAVVQAAVAPVPVAPAAATAVTRTRAVVVVARVAIRTRTPLPPLTRPRRATIAHGVVATVKN